MESNALPERSLDRQVVLEEEEYTEALSHIIARDFFPSLVERDATNEYNGSMGTQDLQLLNASVRRMENVTFTPSTKRGASTSSPSQTPLHSSTPFLGEPSRKRPKFDSDMSLDAFQARYTSQDNSSFTKILDDENTIRKEKWDWAWKAQKKVEEQHIKMIANRKAMLLEPTPVTGVRERFKIELPKPAGFIKQEGEVQADDDAGPVSQSGLMTESSKGDDVAAPNDNRRHNVDSWKFKARNSLMFIPDADVAPYNNLSKPIDSEVNPKRVNYANTRVSKIDSDSRTMLAPPSPTRSHVDAAITGTTYYPRSSAREFPLVPNLPSPSPEELGHTAMKQLMTWGTLTSTPRVISQNGDPSVSHTPFHIPALSSREAISHKLSNKAAKSLRAKAEIFNRVPNSVRPSLLTTKKRIMSTTPRTPRTLELSGNLNPAARRLLDRTSRRTSESMVNNTGWDFGGGGKERSDENV